MSVRAKICLFGVAYLTMVGLFTWAATAKAAPVNASTATAEYMSPMQGDDGFCVEVPSTGSAVNLFASIPGRFSDEEKSQFRWVLITHFDSDDNDVPVCTSYGASGAGTALTCDPSVSPTTTPGAPLLYLTTQRILVTRNGDGSVRPLYAKAKSSAVSVCVKAGW